MKEFDNRELQEAVSAIDEMIKRSKKAKIKYKEGTAQFTLLTNRIKGLKIAMAFLNSEFKQEEMSDIYTIEEIEKAKAPIDSLLSKSKKAKEKLVEGTWQYAALERNIKALSLARPLFEMV